MKKMILTTKRVCTIACVLLALMSCKDTDEFFNNKVSGTTTEPANTFNFSTLQTVDLQIDYSAYDTHGPVQFAIYNCNPFIEETDLTKTIDENIDPIFTGYTDKDGKFDADVTLPSYAKVLYITTGDMFVGTKKMVVAIENGAAKAVADAGAGTTRSAAHRVKGTGEQTNDLSNMYNLWMKTNDNGVSTGEQIYKQWVTPLGTWDSHSGRPSYLLPKTSENIAKGLVFNESELSGLFTASKAALKSTVTCAEQYRTQSDLTLVKESEVSITMLGGNTCWCSTLGYYYYTEDTKPKSTMDMNIIMLFPNTMDEVYEDKPNCDMANNIGVYDGDVVQLMYYPNIANGDLSGATTKFPKGTRIGFIMKTNGWGSQPGSGYSLVKGTGGIGWDCARKYNNWPSSTDGFSYCSALKDTGSKLIKNGNARTAKFGYASPNGKNYPIVSFEDACNDENYSDVIFALNPAEAFDALPEVGANKSTTMGVWAFEDRWPRTGDYDMNDVIVNMKDELNFNDNGKVTKQIFYMTTYKNVVELVTGLAVRLKNYSGATISMKKVDKNGSSTNVTYESYDDNGKKVYYLTENVEAEVGMTYVLELSYSSARAATNVADVEAFVFRKEGDGKQWELHIPYSEPTNRMNYDYFNTYSDKSNFSKGEYYVRTGLYPFAFYLSGTRVDSFLDTLLSSEGENFPIDNFYPDFVPWSRNHGSSNEDWYLKSRK